MCIMYRVVLSPVCGDSLLQLKRTQSRVVDVEEVMDAIKNSTVDGVQAIQEMSRSRGALVQDIYLLKRSNYSMTVSMHEM